MPRWFPRSRIKGNKKLSDSVTLPAGTILTRTRKNGQVEEHVLSADTVFPADSVAADSVTIAGEDWSFLEDDWETE